jgi:hypothetical protein
MQKTANEWSGSPIEFHLVRRSSHNDTFSEISGTIGSKVPQGYDSFCEALVWSEMFSIFEKLLSFSKRSCKPYTYFWYRSFSECREWQICRPGLTSRISISLNLQWCAKPVVEQKWVIESKPIQPSYCIMRGWSNITFARFRLTQWPSRRIMCLSVDSIPFSCSRSPWAKNVIFQGNPMEICPQSHSEVNQKRFGLQYSLVFVASDSWSHAVAEIHGFFLPMDVLTGFWSVLIQQAISQDSLLRAVSIGASILKKLGVFLSTDTECTN